MRLKEALIIVIFDLHLELIPQAKWVRLRYAQCDLQPFSSSWHYT